MFEGDRKGPLHEAMKAIGGLLPIVGANLACIAVVDGGGDEVDVSIDKIDPLTLDSEPCAAIDPGPPPSQISHGGLGSIYFTQPSLPRQGVLATDAPPIC